MKKQTLLKISSCNKLLLLLVMLFGMHMNTYSKTASEDEMNYIIVWDRDGGSISFALEEKPCFKYCFDISVVKCETTKQTIEIPIDDVYKYTLSSEPEIPTLINETSVEGKMTYGADMIYLSKFAPTSKVYLYTIDGVTIANYAIDADGNLVISTASLAAGVYIIKVNNISCKIIKK